MYSQSKSLLTSIWSGETTLAGGNQTTQIRRLIGEIFPIHSIILRVPEGDLCGRVFRDDAEVLPSLPIGDVIAEEFATDVPHGTLIICCSDKLLSEDCSASVCSARLADICSEIILDSVLLGNYQIETETEVFHLLASDALSSAYSHKPTSFDFDASIFGSALASKLDACIREYAIGYEPHHSNEDARAIGPEETLPALELSPKAAQANDGKKANSDSTI